VREGELSAERLGAIVDPADLLTLAWDLEPRGRWSERAEALDRLDDVLAAGGARAAPAGRNWDLELAAERAIDIGRKRDLDGAETLVVRVLRDADPTHETAIARALLARGQALAWIGTDETVRGSRRAFTEAAERFAALGHDDWQGSALLRCGYSACYQFGDLLAAESLIAQALETYPPASDRRPGALDSYADVLIDLGEFDRAEAALQEALSLLERNPTVGRAYEITWGMARVAAGRGDARATERLLREAERGSVGDEWFDTHIGLSYLLEAAELLDRVGLTELAQVELERARQRAGDDNEEVMQTAAVMCARSGDPWRALELLQQLARGEWLEKRTIWRHTLMTAWATYRAGGSDAGALAARALEQAVACGTVRVATAGEPDIVAALAPLAQTAGSGIARELLLQDRVVIVRLFDTPTVIGPDGPSIALPPGRPGQLVRMLAVHEHGLPVEAVIEAFFPDVAPAAGRHRLRQVLTRLRAAAGELVVRDGETLRLVAAWVDLREFHRASERVRGARGSRATQLAYCALALRAGPLLAGDPYADWAQEARERAEYRHLELLDLVAADASARGAHQEALTALEAALVGDPADEDRRAAMVEHQVALHRHRAAGHLRGDGV
jgi:DNA-binding SARP family transcriptional activator/tetratricopeptide (TPR) repeat protein